MHRKYWDRRQVFSFRIPSNQHHFVIVGELVAALNLEVVGVLVEKKGIGVELGLGLEQGLVGMKGTGGIGAGLELEQVLGGTMETGVEPEQELGGTVAEQEQGLAGMKGIGAGLEVADSLVVVAEQEDLEYFVGGVAFVAGVVAEEED